MARLSRTVEWTSLSSPRWLAIPPPSASLATPRAVLCSTRVCLSVSVPQLSMPPPNAPANRHLPVGHSGPIGTRTSGATRFPVITLREIVTVAPPEKSAFGGISIPPPAAKTFAAPVNVTDIGLECVRPPVTVTPATDTVGSCVAWKRPIVITDRPPRTTVRPAPAPTRRTLFVM